MPRTLIPLTIIVIAVGCRNDNDRIAELATRHATQQAELSRETVELQAELVEGTQQLVEADAQARRDFLELERKLDEQRTEIARQHAELDGERREIAERRVRDPVVAEALIVIGSLLACLLPLVLAGYLLRCQLNEPDDHSATEFLLEEIAAGHPGVVAPDRPAIDRSSNRSVPRISGDTDRRSPDDSDRSPHTPN